MKNKTLFLMASLCGVTLLTAGCGTKCPTDPHPNHQEQKMHQKHKKHPEPMVFQQKYSGDDVHYVHAKMFTRSVRGGESEMGYIKFKETEDGLKMNVDLIDLRPGKIYTAQIYQCGACNDSMCCDTEAMAVDLPKIQTNTSERLQESYIIRGLTAAQLNNAKLILTRDGGYKAAWGTATQK